MRYWYRSPHDFKWLEITYVEYRFWQILMSDGPRSECQIGYTDEVGNKLFVAHVVTDSKELTDDECAANAKLLAAAPELFEACTKALRRLNDLELRYPESIQNGATKRLLETAIEKAEGGK